MPDFVHPCTRNLNHYSRSELNGQCLRPGTRVGVGGGEQGQPGNAGVPHGASEGNHHTDVEEQGHALNPS